MSEGDKMGLFGSKDENKESTSDENKKTDETDKEEGPAAEAKGPSDRYAPYDIDSDSETYDTEALSIMDINDIIGVQADTAGDSTLESEFAALSEIITDSKDEYGTLEGNADVAGKRSGGIEDARQKRTVDDCKSQGESRSERADEAQSSSGTASINKSLQLIGEAYISEDSRETEVEDVLEGDTKISVGSCEQTGSSEPPEQTQRDSEVGDQNGGEKVTESGSEATAAGDTGGVEKSEVCGDVAVAEEHEKSQESLGGSEMVESADTTDAAIVTEPEQPEDRDTEMMDVDSTVSSDPLEKLANPTRSIAESVKTEEKDNIIKEEIKASVAEEAKLATEQEAVDEPMEVDEPNETLAKLPIPDSSEKDLMSDRESSNPDAAPTTPTVQPEVGKRSHDEDSVDVVESSAVPENVEDDSSFGPKPETALDEKRELEQPEGPKNEKIASERSDDTEHREQTVEKKSNANEDAPLEEPIVKDILSNISTEPIDESRAEVVREESSTRDDGTESSMENQEVDAREDSGSSKVVDKIEDANEAIEEPEAAIEPMEIDEPEQREIEKLVEPLPTTAENSPQNVEPVSDRIPKNKLDDADVRETLESTMKPAGTMIRIADCDSAENSSDNSAPGVKAAEESSEIAVLVRARSIIDATETPAPVGEEEKMEVDGSSKGKIAKEQMEISQPCTSPRNFGEPIAKEEISAETIDDKPSIDTVDDAPIASPEVERTEPILEKSVPCKSEDSRETVPAECSEEMAEKNEVSDDKADETREEKKKIVGEDTKIAESLKENPEEKVTAITEKQKNVTKEQENITEEQENVTEEQENITEEQENVTEEQENVTEEKKNVAEEKEITTGEKENITEEQENVTEEKEITTGEKENFTEEQENVTEEKENVAEEKEITTGEKENITEEQENITEEQENVIEEKENVAEKKEITTGEKENISEERKNITEEQENVTEEQENDIGEQENISEERKNITEEQENVTEEQENDIGEQENVTEEQENITDEQEKVTEEQENVTEEQENDTGEQESVTQEQENVTEEQENITDEQEKVTEEQENITEEQENVTEEQENITQEQENVTEEQENVPEEKEITTGEKENVTEDQENVTAERENVTEEKEITTREKENVTDERENITTEQKNVAKEKENITTETENIAGEKEDIIAESEDIADKTDAILNIDKAGLQISISASQPPTSENCPLEKADSPGDDAQPSPVENEKDKMEENPTNEVEDTSNCVAQIESPQETPKIEVDSESTAQKEAMLTPNEKPKSQDCESENLVEEAKLDRKEIQIRFPRESVSKDEKVDLSSYVNAETTKDEEMEICQEAAGIRNEEQEVNVISSEETEICSEETEIRSEEIEVCSEKAEIRPEEAEMRPVETEIRSEEIEVCSEKTEIRPEEAEMRPAETEIRPKEAEERQKQTTKAESVSPISAEKAKSLDNELELSASPEEAKTSNEEKDVKSVPLEGTQSSKSQEKDTSSPPSEAPSNAKTEENALETTDSPNHQASEVSSIPDMEVSSQEGEEAVVRSEPSVIKSVVLPEKDATSQEEKMDDSTSSLARTEPSIEEGKLSAPESMQEEQIPNAPKDKAPPKDEESSPCAEISQSSSTEMEQVAASKTIESPSEEYEESPIAVKKSKHPAKEEEENVSPATNENESEVAKPSVPEKKFDESAKSKDSEAESLLFVEETMDETEITEQEEKDPSSRKTSSNESVASFETKDQREEVELSLPVVSASPENPIVDDSRARESPERMYEDQEMEIENKTEAIIPSDSEEKNDEANLIQLAECLDSSAYKTEEASDEVPDKCIEDSEENLKDILSSSSVCVTEIFQDDEQSQSTQEIMESILETNKGNINTILDDQEVDDLEECSAMNGMERLSKESDNMLNKALEDPMTTTNIDSLEGLLDLDLIPETDEANLKSVGPIVDKVMHDGCDDIETIDKNVDVALLMEENDAIENPDESNVYDTRIAAKIMDDSQEMTTSVDELMNKSSIEDDRELEENSDLTEKDLEAFDLASVVTNPLDNVDPSEETKINLAEDLLREIAVEVESKIELTEKLLLDDDMRERDLLLSTTVEEPAKIDISDEVFLPVASERDMELSEDISLDSAVRDQVLNDVAAEMDNLPPNSEISELESAVKFLQESEEQDIDSPLVLSPKMVADVVDDIVENAGIFASEANICADHSELVAELESIIPDPIAISEAEIISEAAKLEIERKTKLTEASKLSPPSVAKVEPVESEMAQVKPSPVATTGFTTVTEEAKYVEDSSETRTVVAKSPEVEKIEREPLKKSAPIPKISILEERLKIPPKIEIPVGEPSRICDLPTTPKTSLLIQRDVRSINLTKQLESPKSTEKRDELRIVDTPRKDSAQHDFENVGSPRIILKIAKSAIADCAEPRSPKSPKIRSATNSPNPEDSPGQKLGKIKLKLSKSGHPSIISNDNFEEHCGQWHTEGSSSLSPLGMKIKFSKISDSSGQADKHEVDEAREPATSKHKFEEAKRTDSPLGMKIKLSRTGEPSIVQQEAKESAIKHKDKFDAQQDSPKRTESSIGMKIKLSKSGDASIIQPDKPETGDEHKEPSTRIKEKLEATQQQQQQYGDRNDTPRRTESPLGMKFKLFKTGDASIVQAETPEDSQQDTKRTDSPLGKKTKPMKTRSSTSVASYEQNEDTKDKLDIPEAPRRTESPLGMKIKLSKRGGDASIIHNDETRESSKPKPEVVQEASPEGPSILKIKPGKSSSTIQPEIHEPESIAETPKRSDSTIGMKIKLSKSGDASIVHPERDETSGRSESHQENVRKIDPSIGVKIKLLKSGDASIIQSQSSKKSEDQSSSLESSREAENTRINESPTGAKAKLPKSAETGIVETSEKREKSSRRKDTEMPIEMKIKLSRTGHPTIVACDNYSETQRGKESGLEISAPVGTSKQSSPRDNTGIKILKNMHAAANLHGNRSELTIEPIQLQRRKSTELVDDSVAKRKDITISPIESKKAKHETKLSHILPEVTIQPIVTRDAKQQIVFEKKAGSISRQQMNVISQEISITQVRSSKPMDLSMTDKLKSILTHNPPVASSDCEIIEHRPELIIVNENSNSSQDVMIIEEVPAIRGPENKVPKKRGRPRRNPLPIILAKPTPTSSQAATIVEPIIQRDPLALDDVAHMVSHMVPQIFPPVQTETHGRPKRTCRNQKSYAPPRRGRGRGGRGKRKMEASAELSKRPRIDQDLELIERSTTALITIHEPPPDLTHSANSSPSGPSHTTSELYKALRQPTMDRKMPNAIARNEIEQAVNETRNDPDEMERDHLESLMDARLMSHLDGVINTSINKATCDENFEKERTLVIVDVTGSDEQIPVDTIPEVEKIDLSIELDEKMIDEEQLKIVDEAKTNKDPANSMDHENWLAPSSKKQCDGRNENNISNVQVMDEETRMSAESGSRSQTPAKNMSLQAPETIVNEESQGSVLSTATTESEKVKVKNRRMEIHFDPDEGPFTVDKIAEYDWPLDPMKKNETFMIQEQISHYLGVKSFKRKYPDLKRRMVDMEERNYLRENGLVSEAMCDMGLTAVLSSEVLDIMCSDFPDQYEEYRKHIREKQLKEHFKKQKELTAAANAEKNRIDLAEMAVQSALSWNMGLNKARRESRKCSLDLQTFTIHVPKKQQKVEEESGANHYPVALIPGQYTDYYREYTPAELRYYPLNTVLYGPMKPNERKFDSQSEGSQSDSDTDSSSDDSSSSSSEGTQDTEASQSTMDDVDAELSRQKEDIKTIKCKMCLKHLNKFSRSELLIQCGTCNGYVHPSCIDLTLDMVPHVQAYAWQCTDCKTCAQCHDPADEDKMLFCDMCDRGYHIYCVGLRRVPQGRWHCQECAVCASCGSREAGGTNSDRNSVAQWQHEYKKGDKNTRVYVSTLCVPCSKLWRKGRYCPHCSRCHTVPRLDLEVNLVHCSACDKYLHLGCVETKDQIVERKNYRCDFCQPLRHHMVKPLVSKVFKT